MKTKSILLLMTAIFFLTFNAHSQYDSKTAFAIQAGLNLQNITGKDNGGDKLENTIAPGFHAGINVIVPVAPDFYFQPGLLFSRKGAKNTELTETVNYNLSYLELPLNLLYRARLGNGNFLLGFGPYLGYAINGKIKSGDNEVDIEFKNTAYPPFS